jgi:Uncharacterized protein conserved in bacteria
MPGPMLFLEQPGFIWGLISSLYTANVFALLVNLALVPLFVWALRMPFPVLCSVVLVLCIVGGYAPNEKMHDVWLIAVFGIAAFLLRRADYPMAPLVLALVLGPLMEKSFRQALISAQGDVLTFVDRPISATLFAISAVLFAAPFLRVFRRGRAAAQPAE